MCSIFSRVLKCGYQPVVLCTVKESLHSKMLQSPLGASVNSHFHRKEGSVKIPFV